VDRARTYARSGVALERETGTQDDCYQARCMYHHRTRASHTARV